MKQEPVISVIVPFFNQERHLVGCIESLLAQEDIGGGVELVFVNNRSTDGSESIVARYDEVHLLDEPTAGAYAARNAGIRRARAPLIAFTDADCVVARDWLRSIVDGMEDSKTAVLLGRCSYPPDASVPLRLLAAWENAKASYVITKCAPSFRFAYANNMAVRTSVFDELGLFKKWQRAADSELVHRLAERRPDLRLSFRSSMRVTHMEFRRARDRARRLSLYTRTNSRIDTFQELGIRRRVAVLLHLLGGGTTD
jgi:glycosyltransferase involved in cell wall biosynthesis